MVMACLTINCALILLNRWSVVMHETRRSELNPFSSQSEIHAREDGHLILQSNPQQINKHKLNFTFIYYLRESPHISVCARPDCPPAEHRPSLLVCRKPALPTSAAEQFLY